MTLIFQNETVFLSESILEAKLSQVDISDGFTILLSHRPEYFNVYQNKNIDLVLSGHAHGGQFRLPLGGELLLQAKDFSRNMTQEPIQRMEQL